MTSSKWMCAIAILMAVLCTEAMCQDVVVFTSNRDGNWEIYTCDPSGQNTVRLTNDPALDANPKLSPMRDKIAFVSNRGGGFNLYVMNIDGSGVTPLTTEGTFGGHNTWGWTAWSPNGQQLLYNHGSSIRRINADGSGMVTLATIPSRGIHNMDWSPSGDKIVFQAQGGWGYTNDLYLMNGDGSDVHIVVADRPGGEGMPRLSPDGTRIAYVYDPSGHEESSGRSLDSRVYVINTDGTGNVDISNGKPSETNDLPYAWSPDGRSVMFANFSNAPGAEQDIWLMASSGAQRQLVFSNAGATDWRGPGTVLCDPFDNSALSNWQLWGSPEPTWTPTVHGRQGVFDNNGHTWSGATSYQTFDLSHGFTLQSDVYLDFFNPELIYMGLNGAGQGCGATPPEQRGHAYLWAAYLTDCGNSEVFGWPDGNNGPVYLADAFANRWTTLRMVVDSATWIPAFYADTTLFYVGRSPVAASVMQQERPLWVAGASSGQAGKAYNDNICFNASAHGVAFPEPSGVVLQTIGTNAHLTWNSSLRCAGNLSVSYLVFFETDPSSDFEFLALTSDTFYVHNQVVRFAPGMYYEVYSYFGPVETLLRVISELGGRPTATHLRERIMSRGEELHSTGTANVVR
jgi:hypothetical protein